MLSNPDPRLLNPNEGAAALGACTRGGRWREALELLSAMTGRGVQPNSICYGSVLTVCGVPSWPAGNGIQKRWASRSRSWGQTNQEQINC